MKKIVILASACLAITGTGFVNVHQREYNNQNKEATTILALQQRERDLQDEARSFKIPLANDKNNQVQIEVYQSSVEVIGHDSEEVVIETKDFRLPERAEGLKSLFSQAEDNTNLGLAVNKEGNLLKIVQAHRRGGHYLIKVPKNVAVLYHESNPHGGNINVADTKGEIDIKLLHGSATLTNITGPVKAHSIHGRLDITFSELHQAEASTINSVHGPIDISLPVNTNADLELSTNHGEIYTDFDLNLAQNGKDGLTKIVGGDTINGKTNNGGVAMNVSAVHSNIFIRKSK